MNSLKARTTDSRPLRNGPAQATQLLPLIRAAQRCDQHIQGRGIAAQPTASAWRRQKRRPGGGVRGTSGNALDIRKLKPHGSDYLGRKWCAKGVSSTSYRKLLHGFSPKVSKSKACVDQVEWKVKSTFWWFRVAWKIGAHHHPPA